MAEDDGRDDEPNEDAGANDELVCPECEAAGNHVTFASPLNLGAHRRMAHGVAGKGRGKSGGSKRRTSTSTNPPKGSRVERRRKAVAETLRELVEFRDAARGDAFAGEPEHLADVIRRDADRIAQAVAWIAERVNPLGHGIDLLLGHGGPVTVLRGFLGVGTWTLQHWRKMIADRNAEQEPPPGFEGGEQVHRFGVVDEPQQVH